MNVYIFEIAQTKLNKQKFSFEHHLKKKMYIYVLYNLIIRNNNA